MRWRELDNASPTEKSRKGGMELNPLLLLEEDPGGLGFSRVVGSEAVGQWLRCGQEERSGDKTCQQLF